MPRFKCSVSCCPNSSADMKLKGISFFKFPQKAELAEEWERRCAQPNAIRTFQARICSLHFTDRDYVEQAGTRMKTLNKHCVPTLHLPDKFTFRSTTLPNIYRVFNHRIVSLASQPTSASVSQSTTNGLVNPMQTEANCFQVGGEAEFQVGATPFPADASRSRSGANAKPAELSPAEAFEADSSPNESLEDNLILNEDGLEAGSISSETLEAGSKNVASDESNTENSALEMEIYALKRKLSKKKKKNVRLKKTVRNLQEQLNESNVNGYQMQRHILGILMSESEMDTFLGVSVVPNWTALEIAKAAVVIYYNKRCFHFMSKVLKYPMPNFHTVKSRVKNAEWRPEIVKQMAEYMRQIDEVESPDERITELSEQEINHLLDNLFE